MAQYPSLLVEKAVEQISRLPGIGKKSALRIVLHLLKKDPELSHSLSNSIKELRDNIKYCKTCGNISDEDICSICQSSRRDRSILCLIEDSRDLMAIENTGQYNGLYHVLGGIISPLDGVGPEELNIAGLISRISESPEIKEVLLALSSTMEGDTTSFYIARKLEKTDIKISSIARGIPIGGELEYADEITLGRSIATRISYNRPGEV